MICISLHLLSLVLFLQSCYGQDAVNETAAKASELGDFVAPDFVECSAIYGTDLKPSSCRSALKKIFPGMLPRHLNVVKKKSGSSSTVLQVPYEFKDESDPSCVITIELAGPPPSDNGKNLWSPTLREMVTALIDECVVLPGWGGFATYGIEDTANSLFKENTRGYKAPLFMTVAVTPPGVDLRPGDTDPRVPLALTGPLQAWQGQALLQKTRDGLAVLMNEMVYQSDRMEAGGKKTWWDNTNFEEITLNGVGYPCDAGLGALPDLNPRDCRQASFEFVRQGDSPDITPGSPLYFRSGLCVFKVESSQGSVSAPWAALRAGADILLYRCLDGTSNPPPPGFGGRVKYTGGGGSSTGYEWPDALTLTMGKVGVAGMDTASIAGQRQPNGGSGRVIIAPGIVGNPAATS